MLAGVAANRIGLLYHRRGQLNEAERWYRNALARYGDGRADRQAQVIGNLGGIASDQGRYRDAIELYRRAIPILRAANDYDQLASTLNNLGAAYARVGDYRLGLRSFRDALDLVDSHNLADDAISTRMLLADLLRRTGRLLEAQGYINEALASPAAKTWPTGRAHVELVNGRIAADLGDHEAAVAAFERAMVIYQRLGRTWSVISCQVSLARSLTGIGKAREAAAMAQAAADSASEHGFARHQGESLLARGPRCPERHGEQHG